MRLRSHGFAWHFITHNNIETEKTSVNGVKVKKRVKLTVCLYTTWDSEQQEDQRHLVTCPASKR